MGSYKIAQVQETTDGDRQERSTEKSKNTNTVATENQSELKNAVLSVLIH
jgi:hypothetical protein